MQAIQEYLEWKRVKPVIELTPKIQEFLNSGIVYVHGRDNRFRPIIVMNMYLLDTQKVTNVTNN